MKNVSFILGGVLIGALAMFFALATYQGWRVTVGIPEPSKEDQYQVLLARYNCTEMIAQATTTVLKFSEDEKQEVVDTGSKIQTCTNGNSYIF